MFKKSKKDGSIVTFYVLNNNFSCTQFDIAFIPQRDFYYVHNDTDVFFLFHLQ